MVDSWKKKYDEENALAVKLSDLSHLTEDCGGVVRKT